MKKTIWIKRLKTTSTRKRNKKYIYKKASSEKTTTIIENDINQRRTRNNIKFKNKTKEQKTIENL